MNIAQTFIKAICNNKQQNNKPPVLPVLKVQTATQTVAGFRVPEFRVAEVLSFTISDIRLRCAAGEPGELQSVAPMVANF